MSAGAVTEPATLAETIRVVVVDDHRTVASAMAMALDSEEGIECIGTVHSAREARWLAQRYVADVVVMDVNLGDGDGIDVAADLVRSAPGLRVVIFSGIVDRPLLRRAANAGVVAVLAKDGTLPELLAAIRGSSSDGLVVQPQLLRRLVGGQAASAVVQLTAREGEVLSLLSEGHDVQRIATELGITVLTCRGYLKHLMAKLDAHTQLEAVLNASRLGLSRPMARD
jgi:two-component system response regulator DesR